MHRQLHLDTSNLGANQRYSFLETPLEMHGPGVHQQRELPPQSWATSEPEDQPIPEQPQTLPPLDEKAQHRQQEAITAGYPGAPNPEQHPANYAPFADDMPQQIQQHDAVVPDYSYIKPPPHSPGPLPPKANPETPDHVTRPQPVAIAPDTNPLQSPQLPYFPGPPTASGVPQTPAVDDVMAYHRPGQSSHPNQQIQGGTWSHSLCDCSNIWTCCLGLLCPCVLYGKTQYRLSRISRKEDPTNMLGFEAFNGSCTAMALLCGCQCEYTIL
ncbi:hypothetical protein BDV25DRAFT_146721 [Aspergillus avenaceus]|uniref:PLAC8 family-domain-containing protein n=1 Tax=Aspergillus avenaceus TaxID=36643 RepID=A0A5N6U9Y3_ASPAV|nr:hypothetical protein BDV25DRAFT_146721 [Aspergillus avenaceus]